MSSPSSITETRANTIEHINHLVSVCKDGEAGFQTAADATQDLSLKSLFSRLAYQRADFASELQLAIRRLGGSPAQSGSPSGSMRRGWQELKSVIVKQDAHAILAECEAAEDDAVAAYREALAQAPLESGLRLVISTQAAAVQAAHDEVRDLRDSPAYRGRG